MKASREGAGEGAGQEGLPDPRGVFDENVASGEKGRDREVDGLVFSDDDPSDVLEEGVESPEIDRRQWRSVSRGWAAVGGSGPLSKAALSRPRPGDFAGEIA